MSHYARSCCFNAGRAGRLPSTVDQQRLGTEHPCPVLFFHVTVKVMVSSRNEAMSCGDQKVGVGGKCETIRGATR